MTKVVGGLKAVVDNQGNAITTLQNTVGNASSGLVKDVKDLKTTVGDSNSGLVKKVADLEKATGSGTGGLADLNTRLTTAEGEIDTLQTNVSALQNNKADKATTLAGYGITDAYTKSQVYTKSEVDGKLSSAYKAQGSKTAAGLTSSLLVAANEGYVYNISDALTITDSNKSLFVEGVKSSYPAGTNVVVVKVGDAYKFDVIAGFVDLTAYAKTADQKTITDALSGRITTLENFKSGKDGYQYVKNLTSTHTNSSTSGAPTNMISVTANNKATGEVTININESALDTKLKATGEALMPIAETTQENVQTTQEELPQLDTIPYKQPVSKRKMAKKFLIGMGSVAVSSILLFLILTIYNKIRESILAPKQDQQSGETSLVTPENLTEAVRTFLDKTKY